MKTGDWVKAVRRQAGLTQEALSFELGITKAAISGWENERHTPSIEQIRSMVAISGLAFPGMSLREQSKDDVSEISHLLTQLSPTAIASLKQIIASASKGRLSDAYVELLAKIAENLAEI